MSLKLKYRYLLGVAVLSVALFACAKQVKEDETASERRRLAAHLTLKYNDTLTELPSGAYIMTTKKGEGKKVGPKSSLYVQYSKSNLDGLYYQTNSEQVAQNVGGYVPSNYYGPTLYQLGVYTTSIGLEEAFLTMREGGSCRVIVPSWASRLDFKGSDRQERETIVYDFEIYEVIDNFVTYELDTLQKFADRYYNGLDSLKEGLYFKHLVVGDGDSVVTKSNVYYNYVGKLLNGFVFDTNIEDTARKYRIYQEGRDYSPVSYEITEFDSVDDFGNIIDASGQSSLVEGFDSALQSMRSGGKAITFFSSEWGYGHTAQPFGTRQQLFFYIEVLDRDD